MRLEARKYLRDIQVALERIERFTEASASSNTLRTTSSDPRSSGNSASLATRFPDSIRILRMWPAAIPDRGRIIAFRNILIHGYAAVDDRIVWGVIENYLASLANAVRELRARP